MGLKKIEEYIRQASKDGVKLNFTPDMPTLSTYSMNSVIHGKNYQIDKLLTFIRVINKHLYVDNEKVLTKEDLGKYLRQNRRKKNLTRLNIFTLTGLCPSKIDIIESGKGYMKNTLVKYLSAFPDINLEIK